MAVQGLGLAISRGLVGRPWAAASGLTAGAGSGIASGSRSRRLRRKPRRRPLASVDIAAFVGLKLLLVDDNAANRELIRSLMTPWA